VRASVNTKDLGVFFVLFWLVQGLMNAIPLPALDGGQLLLIAVATSQFTCFTSSNG
jgi:membrane-associated protease RseP (regulator of RpoE activity)